MATEDKKKENMLRMMGVVITGLVMGIWDMLGESAAALGPKIGEQTLTILEKEMGLEIAGENPEDVMTEVGRINVDEFGFAESVNINSDGSTITAVVKKCMVGNLCEQVKNAGMDNWLCPHLINGLAVLGRLGKKATTTRKLDLSKGCEITFKMI